MIYTISYSNPLSHYIHIELTVTDIRSKKIYLQLPAWRPGRYEIANFAKNIQYVKATDDNGNFLRTRKVSKDRWEVITEKVKALKINYKYYAYQMDAGNSWLDDEQLYINFINCLLYVEERQYEACNVFLKIPDHYKIATGLPLSGPNHLFAKNYYRLVDSPLIASPDIQKYEFEESGVKFFIWIQGKHYLHIDQLIANFRAFTKAQINTFGEFPVTDYHYLIQALPYKHYHGVEHYNSTVITLGPADKLHTPEYLNKLLGICSHELFHTWNVIRIRPEELLPYDFSRENYFETCYVAEGFTTYYGDLYLVRSGVFSKEEFFQELNTLFKRHFDNFGRFNLSVAEASFDLWLDGYSAGVPERKVSVYVKGALIALMLDLKIREHSGGERSLDDVMKTLWLNFGKTYTGYTAQHVRSLCEELTGASFSYFWNEFVEGIIPIEESLNELLDFAGCYLKEAESPAATERLFGFRVSKKETAHVVSLIQPASVAEKLLSLEDEIIAVNGNKVNDKVDDLVEHEEIELTLFRNNKLKTIMLKSNGERYFRQFLIAQKSDANDKQIRNFEKWLNCSWK